jgi:heat shock protein HspQ
VSGSSPTNDRDARFGIGQVVHHQRFEYRGVIVDVDATYQGTEEWYHEVARSRPPRDQPWYHVLVHEADHATYVAERHLEPDPSPEPIRHPLLGEHFDTFEDGRYSRRNTLN